MKVLASRQGRFVSNDKLAEALWPGRLPSDHYEARWAQVEVASALGDSSAPGLAREALDRLDAGGVRQGRERLLKLAKSSS